MTRPKPRARAVKKTTVSWQDPPPQRERHDWDLIAKQLRSKPGEWAKVFDQGKTSLVNAIRQGAVVPLHPDLGFEVRTARNVREPVRVCDLYMRWVPERADPLREALLNQRGKR